VLLFQFPYNKDFGMLRTIRPLTISDMNYSKQ
jgi:hypothetical protein